MKQPRIRDARITGATWVITTNPFHSAARQADIFRRNLRDLAEIFSRDPENVVVVGKLEGYRTATGDMYHRSSCPYYCYSGRGSRFTGERLGWRDHHARRHAHLQRITTSSPAYA